MNTILSWIDDRTGLVSAWRQTADQRLPGAPSLRYVLPSMLLCGFLVEAITGVCLWMFYSAGTQSAWESVFWVQEHVMGGWLLRGVHSFTGHAMVVLAMLWLLQLVLGWLYRAPREFVFWIALGIFGCLLGLLLTGDLLRWDQEGATATQVRVRFALMLPFVGESAYKVVSGGTDFGSLTLTRFLALHGGVLSAALGALLVCNHFVVRRVGLKGSAKAPAEGGAFWPCQATLNSIAWLALVVIVGAILLWPAMHGAHKGQPHGQYLGAALGAPAEPGSAYAAARPEWAFLALYQFAHLFPGEKAYIPIFIVPSLLALYALLMPFIGRILLGHLLNLAFAFGLIGAALWLSVMCIQNDRKDEQHQAALAQGEHDAERVKELMRFRGGAPLAGAGSLLREDPKTAGPKLFERHCASCHAFVDGGGKGIKSEKQSAPNLYHFASREWLAGLLDAKRITKPEYFGNTAFRKGAMAGYVKDTFGELDDDIKAQRDKVVLAMSALAQLPYQKDADAKDAAKIKEGREHLTKKDFDCIDCHRFDGKGPRKDGYPDLTGYGTREWLVGIIGNPAHERFYGTKNDRMPIYASATSPISAKEIEVLADFLRQDWYEPAVAEAPKSAAPAK
jgi:ubiquinol-cytochrome c reductase cytochrome b subunit